MGRRKKKQEIKIKFIDNKIKIVKTESDKNTNDLKDFEKRESDQFSESFEMGRVGAPVLKKNNSIENVADNPDLSRGDVRTADDRLEKSKKNEFSAYEIARINEPEIAESKRKKYIPSANWLSDNSENVRNREIGEQQGINFRNDELGMLRQNKREDEYYSNIKIDTEKKKKRLPWEG